MSKRNRPVEVTIDEEKRDGQEVLVVRIKDKEIGVVIPSGDGGYLAQLFTERPVRVKMQDEAVALLLENYNLHH